MIEFGSDVLPGRIWDKVDTEGDHWVWTGASSPSRFTTGRTAVTTFDGKQHLVQRVFHHALRGSVLGEVTVHASCGRELCVNPDHLVAKKKVRKAFRCVECREPYVVTLGSPQAPPYGRADRARCPACMKRRRIERSLRDPYAEFHADEDERW